MSHTHTSPGSAPSVYIGLEEEQEKEEEKGVELRNICTLKQRKHIYIFSIQCFTAAHVSINICTFFTKFYESSNISCLKPTEPEAD